MISMLLLETESFFCVFSTPASFSTTLERLHVDFSSVLNGEIAFFFLKDSKLINANAFAWIFFAEYLCSCTRNISMTFLFSEKKVNKTRVGVHAGGERIVIPISMLIKGLIRRFRINRKQIVLSAEEKTSSICLRVLYYLFLIETLFRALHYKF